MKSLMVAVMMVMVVVSVSMACDSTPFYAGGMTYFMSNEGAVILFGNKLSGNKLHAEGSKIYKVVSIQGECSFNILKHLADYGYSADVSVEFLYNSKDEISGMKRCWQENEVVCSKHEGSFEDIVSKIHKLKLK
jgi:hypothetical protein